MFRNARTLHIDGKEYHWAWCKGKRDRVAIQLPSGLKIFPKPHEVLNITKEEWMGEEPFYEFEGDCKPSHSNKSVATIKPSDLMRFLKREVIGHEDQASKRFTCPPNLKW